MSQAVSDGGGDQPSQAGGAAHGDHGHRKAGVVALAVGAVGVVFGDIGTSPLYAFRETFASHHGVPGIQVDPVHIHGVLSLVFWSMMMVVTFKYALTIMRADNKGEGGSLALLALINRKSENARWTAPFVLLGVFATALFYGDSMITPAMSVLSATEGLQYVHPGFKQWIVPMQAILGGILVTMSLLDPKSALGMFSLLAGIGAFASATQDIAQHVERIVHMTDSTTTAIADIAAEAEALKDEARTLNLALERFRI